MKEKKYCKVRTELTQKGELIQIGNCWVSDGQFQYKWFCDQFYVLFEGYWQEADSIDFEF